MQVNKLFHEVLDVQSPWQIIKVSVDRDDDRIDVHLGYNGNAKKSLFNFGRKKSGAADDGRQTCPHCKTVLPNYDEADTIAVRHLPTAGFTTWLHIPSTGIGRTPDSDCSCNRQWRKPGTDCSPSFFSMVEKLLKVQENGERIREYLGLTTSEMEQILELVEIPNRQGLKNDATSTESDTTGIPGFTHPNWIKLVKKELPFETKMVALSMLLRRIQSGFEKEPTTDFGVTGVKMLRQFFIRNEKLLQNEIVAIKGIPALEKTIAVAKDRQETDTTTIPSTSSPIWQQIVEGTLILQTKNIALQMLISRSLLQAKKKPGIATLGIGIRSVRNFFIVNEKALKHEIAQLNQRR